MENDATVAPIVQAILDDPTIPVYVSTITEAELFSHTNLRGVSGFAPTGSEMTRRLSSSHLGSR